MKKKSQISLFIILGIVVLGLFFFIFLTPNNINSNVVAFEKSTINNYITSCLKQASEDALFLLGKQGGNINPESYLESNDFRISYLYKNEETNVPSKKNIEEQLSKYIDNNILTCLNNFDDFKKQGWEVNFDNPITKTSINLKDISLLLNFDVGIGKGDSIINFKEFSHIADVRLTKILEATNKIVDFHLIEEEWTDLTTLSGYNLEITIFPYKNTLTYSIEDKKSELSGETYLFNFALDFS